MEFKVLHLAFPDISQDSACLLHLISATSTAKIPSPFSAWSKVRGHRWPFTPILQLSAIWIYGSWNRIWCSSHRSAWDGVSHSCSWKGQLCNITPCCKTEPSIHQLSTSHPEWPSTWVPKADNRHYILRCLPRNRPSLKCTRRKKTWGCLLTFWRRLHWKDEEIWSSSAKFYPLPWWKDKIIPIQMLHSKHL